MLALLKDLFETICKNLNVCDTKKLTSNNKQLQNDILTDNAYWAEQFQIHFPHLIEKITRKNEPKNWYSAFEKAYIDEYKFNIPHSGSLVELPTPTLAALFTAAKSGNASEFKKLYLQVSSGPFNIEPLFYSCDKHGYTCYDWLYKNGYQNILDDLFNGFNLKLETITDKEPSERLKFIKLNLAIACNQKNYVEEHTKNLSILPSSLLLSAVQLGSLDLVKLLSEKKINIPEITIPKAFIQATSFGHTHIAEFFHEKIIQLNEPEIKQKYKSIMYQALLGSIMNEHKKMFEILLTLGKENNFDINCIPVKNFFAYQTMNNKNSILDCAAQIEDSDYVKMILETGANIHPANVNSYSTFEKAIYKGNYETLITLLQKNAELNNYDYARIKNWITNSHGNKKEIEKPPKEIDLYELVEFMIYKYEIKNEAETKKTLSTLIYSMLHIERPQDKAVKTRVYDMLFEIMIGKRTSIDINKLSSVEQKVLNNKEKHLPNIYKNLPNANYGLN